MILGIFFLWAVGGLGYLVFDFQRQAKHARIIIPPPNTFLEWVIMYPCLILGCLVAVCYAIVCALVWCCTFGRIDLDPD
jgi:hypothetical protein